MDPLDPTANPMVRAGKLSDLEAAPFQAVTLLGKRVAFFRGPGGDIRALEMSCKHQGADLTAGRFENGTVTCPRHGWRYDLETGACLNQPLSPPLRRHAVETSGDEVRVSLRPVA